MGGFFADLARRSRKLATYSRQCILSGTWLLVVPSKVLFRSRAVTSRYGFKASRWSLSFKTGRTLYLPCFPVELEIARGRGFTTRKFFILGQKVNPFRLRRNRSTAVRCTFLLILHAFCRSTVLQLTDLLTSIHLQFRGLLLLLKRLFHP